MVAGNVELGFEILWELSPHVLLLLMLGAWT